MIEPVVEEAFPSWPHFSEEEVGAVAGVLRSGQVNYWTGQQCRLFEEEFSRYLKCPHAIALANGTVALECALHALGIGEDPKDEVIVPARTFIASATSILACGARPVFAEIDPITQNIDLDHMQSLRTPHTRAVLVVHLGGWPCPMDAIVAWAHKHDLRVIEDCAQAHGARYQGRSVGSWGDVATFSFCQDKIMTTGGEGGMLVAQEKAIWERAWAYKEHGKDCVRAFKQAEPPSPAAFRWIHDHKGTNARMTEMQAAIGRIQLRALDGWVQRRRRYAQLLDAACLDIVGLRVAYPLEEAVYHAYYRYTVFVVPELLKPDWDRDRIIGALCALSIPCLAGICPEIYHERVFMDRNLGPEQRFPEAEALGETSVTLQLHHRLEKVHIARMVAALKRVMSQACVLFEECTPA